MAGIPVRHLGDYIREQRASSQISLRQLATLAGVSNPYLSQIERGLRKPSAEILQQIAKGLRISAEALYVQAGILDQRESSGVVDALLADETLTERQKQVLLEIYDSFRKENAALSISPDAAATLADAVSVADATLADAASAADGSPSDRDAPAPEASPAASSAAEAGAAPDAEAPAAPRTRRRSTGSRPKTATRRRAGERPARGSGTSDA